MSAERVALTPSATPAGCPADERRWQAWLTDDEAPELAFYCPGCGEREFGGE